MNNKKHKLENYDAGQLDRAAGNRWVTMSNALTRAGHGLNLSEKRIIAWAVSMLDSRKNYRPDEVARTRITASDYAEQFDVDLDTAYTQLSAGSKNLYNRTITFYEAANRRKGKPLEPTTVQMRWVGSVKYQKGEGWVELSWWPELIPHLTSLRRQFTSYQLKQASALRSIYSWKLLELLMRFKTTGQAEYTIEDFAKAMDATDKQKKDFSKIRTKMIEPAVKELCEKDNWLIKWEPVTAGRKVKAVRFKFGKNPQGELDI